MTKTTIVMRAHNDMPLVAQTLAGVARQRAPHRLVALDNGSTDGTREELAKHAEQVIDVPKGSYVPGRVLNQGLRETNGELVVFLNSDCTPQNDRWLETLLAQFEDDKTAAVFGRQVPRPECHPLFAKDTDDTFGDGKLQMGWRHCFSMASSAIRRSVWEAMPFDEEITYSEDIEWTWRARGEGYRVRYAPDSIVMHSHNYTLRQFYRRHFGEGLAEASIFDWQTWEKSLLRYSLLPMARQILSDWKYCLARFEPAAAAFSPFLRGAQMLGRRAGFARGMKERNGR